ncbi:CUTA-like protein [Mya arenaria]|uniref:CUTA-like protein n=1 Tax=Mya arenaria TaxID=6604 RepID=A0ABY7G8G9_MYAAR|nr:CUTA-like protein [Mya arenaria]
MYVCHMMQVLVAYCCMTTLGGVFRRTFGAMASNYVAGTHSMAFVTVPDIAVGKKLAHGIVKGRLAACVNIIPSVTSVENHPYDCAEVISSKIDDGNEPYLKWIGETVSKPVINDVDSGGDTGSDVKKAN